jgi:predicted aconitase with swiveling domain
MSAPQAFSFKCHRITGGSGEAKALISSDNICFYLTDPTTGVITEKNHALEGQSVANKIVIFPGGKGSSVVQGAGLYYLMEKGKVPKALIIQNPDTVLVASAVMLNIPLVDRVDEEFYKQVENDSYVNVDADKEVVTLIKG